MSVNEHATKEQVNRLVNTALAAIKNKDKTPNWNQTLTQTLDQLSLIGRNLNTAKHGVQHFGRVMASDTNRHNTYRANQSVNSKLETLSSLESFLAKEWKKIGDALNADLRKIPTEGKNEMELLDMLAGEIESFDKLLRQNVSKVSKHNSNPHQTMIIQREITQLNAMPALTAPSMLVLISIGIRLFAMFVGAKKVSSNK
ncbi:hypothetical protein JF535_12775 [Microbulbifer salipaludis]|uniref:Uncharacterized protein n=1 Tax=Microbulbifer salipaludis TaxID=187980 RepID=A0ABS3E8T2_9GAMM|nr:hypothetical protein [Microbulbifer salipaludis]MBN8431725.1 hypothetical protein [Microbulbifer salipaludis]